MSKGCLVLKRIKIAFKQRQFTFKVNITDSETGGSKNEYQEIDEKLIKFNNTDGKTSAHTVTEVTPINREEEASQAAEQKSDNKNALYPSYYRDDRYKALKGLLNLRCMFCGSCSPIKFDMDLHLYENHRENLFTDLPIKKKKGFRMNDRIDYAINRMESEAHKSKRYFGIGGH